MFAVLTCTVTARATSYELKYSAAPGCPAQDAFITEIASRAKGAHHAPGAGEWKFEVRITSTSEGFRGKLQVEGDASSRVVSGATCVAVAEALALVAAMNLAPQQTVLPPPRTEEPAHAPRVAPSKPAARPPVRKPPAATVLIGSGALISAGPAPDALIGVAAFGDIEPVGWPMFRLGLTRASTGIREVGSGAARFALTTARIEACPGAVDLAGVSASACAAFEAGVLQAQGLARGEISEPSSVSRAWMDVGLGSRFSWKVLDPLRIELSGAMGLPLTRRSFVFSNPREEVHEPSVFVGRAGVGLATEVP